MRGLGAARGGRAKIPLAVASGLTTGVLAGVVVLQIGGEDARAGGDRAEPGSEAAETMARSEAAEVDAGSALDEPAEPDAAPADEEARVEGEDGADEEEEEAEEEEIGAAEEEADEAEEADESTRPERPAERTATLRFDLEPSDPRGLAISVDGEPASGTSHEVEIQGVSERVEVSVRARGFLTWRRTVTVRGDRTLSIELERPTPTDDGPGGAIDL